MRGPQAIHKVKICAAIELKSVQDCIFMIETQTAAGKHGPEAKGNLRPGEVVKAA